jgi:CDP-glycerol glycerophosphotransferase (TagB/SpsB family)
MSTVKLTAKKVLYNLMSGLNKIVPKNRRLIFINAKEIVRWNSLTLMDYLIKNEYQKRYKIVCYASSRTKLMSKYEWSNNYVSTNAIKCMWIRLRCGYYFTELVNDMFACKPGREQICFQMWHGIALKSVGYDKKNQYALSSFNRVLCYSDCTANMMQQDWYFSDDKIVISQNPRCDLLFKTNKTEGIIDTRYRNVIWLPTFRNDQTLEHKNSSIDFPLLTDKTIVQLNAILAEHNIMLYIKLHPIQRHIPFLSKGFSNIRILSDESLLMHKTNLYEIMGLSDAILSDYSSVAIDYMLLDKPIGYVIDDLDEYSNERGFHVDNPLSFMPGHHIISFDDLIAFFTDIGKGFDTYKEYRHSVNDCLNHFQDGNNCKRVLDAVGISLS